MKNWTRESGLKEAERMGLVRWLNDAENSFLKKIKTESEWEAFFDFFVALARNIRANKAAFARDFMKIYYETADEFTCPNGEQYDRATRGIMSQSLVGVVESLLEHKIVPKDFVEEVKQCEAAERVAVFAKNN